ncbi:4'-phosphopantetheinyl transferase EntD [Kitasatospora sp. MAP12-15]|uniref:4'-phosphopantetheinyl transferase family protein n=1 Tax=unclassified Kitasatospora TaxID=2633591 RepID=UPI002476ACEF|nr:4'-phosphopantetheinyl transferase superfamily protein [Kitasatospora sp. MAP12-44]MDH6113691.1 4'-phosphopantetheinyl transferase EntD [Kitasatospora sp. MAP12-44]
MIETILGPSVVSAEAREDDPNAFLFPDEEEAIFQAVAKRRSEYTTARVCARRAMAALGLPPSPVVSGLRGEPHWPDGVVGSITHCAGYRGAVLGRVGEVTSIGIDAEPNLKLSPGVLESVALPGEQVWVRDLGIAEPEICWDRLLFSAKESVYKAWFPLAHSWLDFEDALITADPEQGTFAARLLVPGIEVHGRKLTGFSGRWLVRDGLILTAIVVLPPTS